MKKTRILIITMMLLILLINVNAIEEKTQKVFLQQNTPQNENQTNQIIKKMIEKAKISFTIVAEKKEEEKTEDEEEKTEDIYFTVYPTNNQIQISQDIINNITQINVNIEPYKDELLKQTLQNQPPNRTIGIDVCIAETCYTYWRTIHDGIWSLLLDEEHLNQIKKGTTSMTIKLKENENKITSKTIGIHSIQPQQTQTNKTQIIKKMIKNTKISFVINAKKKEEEKTEDEEEKTEDISFAVYPTNNQIQINQDIINNIATLKVYADFYTDELLKQTLQSYPENIDIDVCINPQEAASNQENCKTKSIQKGGPVFYLSTTWLQQHSKAELQINISWKDTESQTEIKSEKKIDLIAIDAKIDMEKETEVDEGSKANKPEAAGEVTFADTRSECNLRNDTKEYYNKKSISFYCQKEKCSPRAGMTVINGVCSSDKPNCCVSKITVEYKAKYNNKDVVGVCKSINQCHNEGGKSIPGYCVDFRKGYTYLRQGEWAKGEDIQLCIKDDTTRQKIKKEEVENLSKYRQCNDGFSFNPNLEGQEKCYYIANTQQLKLNVNDKIKLGIGTGSLKPDEIIKYGKEINVTEGMSQAILFLELKNTCKQEKTKYSIGLFKDDKIVEGTQADITIDCTAIKPQRVAVIINENDKTTKEIIEKLKNKEELTKNNIQLEEYTKKFVLENKSKFDLKAFDLTFNLEVNKQECNSKPKIEIAKPTETGQKEKILMEKIKAIVEEIETQKIKEIIENAKIFLDIKARNQTSPSAIYNYFTIQLHENTPIEINENIIQNLNEITLTIDLYKNNIIKQTNEEKIDKNIKITTCINDECNEKEYSLTTASIQNSLNEKMLNQIKNNTQNNTQTTTIKTTITYENQKIIEKEIKIQKTQTEQTANITEMLANSKIGLYIETNNPEYYFLAYPEKDSKLEINKEIIDNRKEIKLYIKFYKNKLLTRPLNKQELEKITTQICVNDKCMNDKDIYTNYSQQDIDLTDQQQINEIINADDSVRIKIIRQYGNTKMERSITINKVSSEILTPRIAETTTNEKIPVITISCVKSNTQKENILKILSQTIKETFEFKEVSVALVIPKINEGQEIPEETNKIVEETKKMLWNAKIFAEIFLAKEKEEEKEELDNFDLILNLRAQPICEEQEQQLQLTEIRLPEKRFSFNLNEIAETEKSFANELKVALGHASEKAEANEYAVKEADILINCLPKEERIKKASELISKAAQETFSLQGKKIVLDPGHDKQDTGTTVDIQTINFNELSDNELRTFFRNHGQEFFLNWNNLKEEEKKQKIESSIDSIKKGNFNITVRQKITEARVNSRVAELLKEFLENKGAMVKLTRNENESATLEERAEMANNFDGQGHADFFVSIHMDSITDTEKCKNISGGPKAIIKCNSLKAENTEKADYLPLYDSCPNNDFDKVEMELAVNILRELNKVFDKKKTEIKFAASNVGVLSKLDPKVKGLLLEVGFLCNPKDLKKIITKEDLIAKTIALGISTTVVLPA